MNWRGYYKIPLTDKKGKPTRGRPRQHWVAYKGRILVSFAYIYPAGVTPPALLPAGKRRNVNLTQSPNGEPMPPIWREVEGSRPVAVQYQLSPDLVRGLTGNSEHRVDDLARQNLRLTQDLRPQPDGDEVADLGLSSGQEVADPKP